MPNILLAAPVLFMSAAGCAAYCALTWRRGLGLAWLLRGVRGQRAGRSGERGYGADAVAPYVMHWAFATAAAALVLHVQVSAPSSATSLVPVTRMRLPQCVTMTVRPLASTLNAIGEATSRQ